MNLRREVCILVLVLGAFLFAAAQQLPVAEPPFQTDVLVLGVYHMANPGRDIFNMQADDVLAPKRQTEIVHLIEVLKKFRPTKLALEADVFSDRIQKTYAEYLAGKHVLTRNEIEQIGFRLAKELGHQTVHPVDVDGDFPYVRLANHAKAVGRTKELDAISHEFGRRVKAQGQYLASHTVLETLLYMNSDDRIAGEIGLYYRMSHFCEPGDWAGADLVSDWFRRNMRIYANISRLADAPGQRILVIYGAGHLGWLQHSFASDPNFVLRKLAEFTR
jgi:hypothetical protein